MRVDEFQRGQLDRPQAIPDARNPGREAGSGNGGSSLGHGSGSIPKTSLWRIMMAIRLGGRSGLALWLRTDLRISNTGQKPSKQEHVWGLRALGLVPAWLPGMPSLLCQEYTECFFRETSWNYPFPSSLRINATGWWARECAAAEEKGGELTGLWASVSSVFP